MAWEKMDIVPNFYHVRFFYFCKYLVRGVLYFAFVK